MKKSKSGFMLILCLLLSVFLLVIVLGMLGSRGSAQLASASTLLHQRALAVAEAGLEDFRVKLGKDIGFPPVPSAEQPHFTYSEALLASDGSLVGHFTVLVDQAMDIQPYYILRVTCSGWLGDSPSLQGQARIYEELDICPFDRSDPSQVNPQLFQVLLRKELP